MSFRMERIYLDHAPGLSIKKELTDWSVDREGFTSCFDDTIHASR